MYYARNATSCFTCAAVLTFELTRPSARRQICSSMKKCVSTFAKLLIPTDSCGVMAACMGDIELNNFISSMIHGYMACKRGSAERRMLWALIGS